MDTPVPESDDKLRQSAHSDRITIASGKAKVGDLYGPAVVHKKITCLEIAMQYPVGMAMIDGGQQLKHERFDFRLKER